MSSGLLVLTLSAEEFDDLTEKDGSSVKTLMLGLCIEGFGCFGCRFRFRDVSWCEFWIGLLWVLM